MEYRPSWRAFGGSLVYDLSPVFMAAIVTYFAYESARWWLWVANAAMVLLSVYSCTQSIFVYLQRLHLDDRGIGATTVFGARAIAWTDVVNATLRERLNPITRTDRLLIVKSRRATMLFNTSTLSEADEEDVLAKVRARVPLLLQRDRPAI